MSHNFLTVYNERQSLQFCSKELFGILMDSHLEVYSPEQNQHK